MTPARTGGKSGNFELQARFKNVGEIRRSLGTKSLTEFNNRKALLRKLEKRERWDLLRAFRDGEMKIEQLIEADANDRLGATLSDTLLAGNLWDAVERALPKIRKGKSTVDRYAQSFRSLQVKAGRYLSDKATIADLRAVPWDDLLEEWGASGADWMHMKRAISKVVGVILGDKYHEFVRKLRQEIPNTRVKKRRPRISPADFTKIVAHAPEHAARSYWCLVITGLRDRVEYLRLRPEHLDRRNFTITIAKSKNEQSEEPIKVSPRLWPMVEAAVPSRLQYAWLIKHWRRACVAAGYGEFTQATDEKPELGYVGPTLHDLRHAHGQWAIDKKVQESKVQASLRHDNPGQTRDYVSYNATGEVSEALADVIIKARKPKVEKRSKRA